MNWLAGWKYRLKLTIDHTKVDSDLTWFPVMIKLSTSSGIDDTDVSAVFDELGTNSLKIAVTQSDGYTENYVEIEKWDSAGEDAILWASKDGWVIDNDIDTTLYLYYDSSHADNSTYVGIVGSTLGKAVWDSSFALVDHMADNSDTSHTKDSTSNAFTGTKKGANEPVETTGQIYKAQQHDGSDDYISYGTNNIVAYQPLGMTVEMIVSLSSIAHTGNDCIAGVDGQGADNRQWLVGANAGNAGRLFCYVLHANSSAYIGRRMSVASAMVAGVPALIQATWDGGTTNANIKIFKNGVQVDDTDLGVGNFIGISDTGIPFRIGANGAVSPGAAAPITVSELRLSAGARSDAWITATKSTLSDELITFETENSVTPSYNIQVDWDNDGDFYDTYDDITSDVKSISYSRGKSDELGKAEVGQCSLTLNNADGKYTPGYGGVISALLLPKRPIQVWALYNGTKYDGYYGFIEEIIPHPHLSEQDCIITAVDGIDFLSRHDLSTTLTKNALTGTIHGLILDDAGWSATMRTLDAGQDTVPYWYGADVKARFVQEEIDDSEQGFSYISGNGYFNFEDRHHRSTATHQTSQATFDNTMAYITYSLNPKNVYNIVKVTVTPWELQSEAELWRLQEVPSIAVGDTQIWWGNTQYPVDAWVTPASTTDYTANSQADGGGDDMTSDIAITTTKFAKSIKLAIKNNGIVPAYITLLKARGTYYDDQTTVTRKAEDTTSQTAYQKRTLTIDGKYMTDAALAQDLSNYAIGKYKDPRAELSLSLINQDAATLTQILSREISDRITVVNTKLGISADYFIDYMQHDISMGGKLHTATYRLADCINEDFWCWDFSKWDSQTKWGY
jgi:hypothetical protein